MSRTPKTPRCVGSPSFAPDEVIEDAPRLQQARELLAANDLYNASRVLLSLPERDSFTYHAMTSVKLAEVQHVVGLGGVNNLHAWYRDEDGTAVSSIPLYCLIQVMKLELKTKSCRESRRRYQISRRTSPSSAPQPPRRLLSRTLRPTQRRRQSGPRPRGTWQRSATYTRHWPHS